MTSYLRPDEKEAKSDILRSKKQDEFIKSSLKTAGSVATGVTGIGVASKAVGPLSSKLLPFINKYISPELAVKGISKVSPEIGNLLKKGMGQGLDVKDGLNFIKNQIEKKNDISKQSKNIIEQESPELHDYLLNEIKKGRKPIEAAALAQNDKKFSEIVKKLMKKHKTPWSSIIESIFGSGDLALTQQLQQESPIQEQRQQSQQMQQGQSQQGNQAKQQLLQAMQALSQQLRQ